jgi:hypothetical protein
MPRHLQVTEFGPEANGLGSLEYITLSLSTNPVELDFENKNTRNAILNLTVSKNLNIVNIPDGAEGNLVVFMGPTGNETLGFVNDTVRGGQTSGLLNRDPGSITLLTIKKIGLQIIVTSSAIGSYNNTGSSGLVPNSIGQQPGVVLKKTGWGLIGPESMNNDFNEFYRNRSNHTGVQSSSTISDFRDAVRSNPINLMAPPNNNVNMNMKRITNLADPINPFDAVNAIYVSDAITSIETLLFNQMFS